MSYGVDLYWLPLGAGGHSVRVNGIVFEAVSAWARRRPRYDLYHSAIEVHAPDGRYVIEMTPVRSHADPQRSAITGGAVGSRWAGYLPIFRYEVVRWREGVIPDVGEAVDSPQRLTEDGDLVVRVLELVPHLPTPVWGRDELGTGEMWNSNSVSSWLLTRAGIVAGTIRPPAGGRAPGWEAGIVVALRQAQRPMPAAPGEPLTAR